MTVKLINENHFKCCSDGVDPFACYNCGCLDLIRSPDPRDDNIMVYNTKSLVQLNFICPNCRDKRNGNTGKGDWFCSVISRKCFASDYARNKAIKNLATGNFISLYTIDDVMINEYHVGIIND